jgi:phosphate transport system substrate-binding protein
VAALKLGMLSNTKHIEKEKAMKSKLMGIWLLAAVLLLSLAVTATAGDLDAFKDTSGSLKISGGTAHIPVMKVAAQNIMRANAEIKISIAGGGSGAGIKQVGEGLVDIGNSGRKPSEAELEKYSLKMHQWAIDGVGVVVNPGNPVKSLSTAQLKDIYAGKLTNWKALGGPDKSINIYTRDKASGTRAVFWKKALSKGDISTKAHFVPSNGAMKTAVAQDPYAIGYVSVGHIDKSAAPVAIDGVAPTLDNVKKGKYKVARGLYSNTKGDPGGLAKKFIDYLCSAEGQKIVSEKGFIPVK